MKKAQATVEYIFLIALVASAVIAMLFYISRGLQGNVRKQADQLGAGQFERGKTSVDNTETKHVTSRVSSRIVTTSVYGDQTAFNKVQDDTDDNFLKQRELESKLVLANYNWEKALEYEAQQRLAKQSSGLSVLWDKIQSAWGGGKTTSSEKPKNEQLADLRQNLDDNLAKNSELNEQLANFPSGAEYAERKKALQNQIANNVLQQATLQDTYDLLIVDPNYKTSFDADGNDQRRLDFLVPSNQDADTTTSASVQAFYDMASKPPKKPPYDTAAQAKNNIEARQKNRQKIAEEAAVAARGSATIPSDTGGTDAQKQQEVDNIYEAIKKNTPPPGGNVIVPDACKVFSVDQLIAGKCSKLFSDQIETLNNDLKTNDKDYQDLLKLSDKEEGKIKDTKSTKSYGLDSGTVTINKTINESLGDL